MGIDYKLIKHSSKGYQEHFEKEYQRIDDLRNANIDIAKLIFCHALAENK